MTEEEMNHHLNGITEDQLIIVRRMIRNGHTAGTIMTETGLSLLQVSSVFQQVSAPLPPLDPSDFNCVSSHHHY